MDEASFKQQFIAGFLSTFAAVIYEECCQNGTLERLDRLPVEDAKYLADAAWEHWEKTVP